MKESHMKHIQPRITDYANIKKMKESQILVRTQRKWTHKLHSQTFWYLQLQQGLLMHCQIVWISSTWNEETFGIFFQYMQVLYSFLPEKYTWYVYINKTCHFWQTAHFNSCFFHKSTFSCEKNAFKTAWSREWVEMVHWHDLPHHFWMTQVLFYAQAKNCCKVDNTSSV